MLALAQEPLAEPGVGCERRVEHLQRHGPPVGIAREVDGPGGTLTKQRLDPVAGDVRARREQVRHARRSYSCPRNPRPVSLRRRLQDWPINWPAAPRHPVEPLHRAKNGHAAAHLENRRRGNSSAGSNPAPSAHREAATWALHPRPAATPTARRTRRRRCRSCRRCRAHLLDVGRRSLAPAPMLVADRVLGAARLLRLRRLAAGLHRLVVQRLPVGVDRRAVGCPADVVPHRGPVGAAGGGVDVVTEELRRQVVLAEPRASPAAPRWTWANAPTPPAAVGVQDDADELRSFAGPDRALPERRRAKRCRRPRPPCRPARSPAPSSSRARPARSIAPGAVQVAPPLVGGAEPAPARG